VVDAVIELSCITAVSLARFGRVTVLTSDGWAIKVELKLHSQMGRSSSIPPEVVATSRFVARVMFGINLGGFQNTHCTIEAMQRLRDTRSLATRPVSGRAPP
jgi:hypothetical protein